MTKEADLNDAFEDTRRAMAHTMFPHGREAEVERLDAIIDSFDRAPIGIQRSAMPWWSTSQ